MRNNIFLFLLLFVSVSFTSCFEILEEVNQKRDGSGDLTITANLSQSKEQVAGYLKAEETNGVLQNRNLESIFKHVKVVLEGVDEISNVNIDSDYTNYIFKISADYKNVNALNTAVAEVSSALSYLYVPALTAKSFEASNGRFERKFDYPIDIEAYNDIPSFVRYTLESAMVTGIYRFESPVKSISNKSAEIAANKKAVKLTTSIAKLAQGQETMANKISF